MSEDRPLFEGEYRVTKILGVNKYEHCGQFANVRALLRITETARGLRRMDIRAEARRYYHLSAIEFSFDKPVTIDKSREDHALPQSLNTQLLFKIDEGIHSMNLTIRIRAQLDDDEFSQEITFRLRL
ncbi:hypothetical protein PENTCL1PPCAC_12261 [Pristionchus entomophagus]|uniref:Uncharacterized protein n=1 Tax=Pristionchus entomophagus TaxID=358040 RepID=A0AAV5T3C2_9BILA|nr:hypothetical protein PENTCL1PPCAC_12261 [Pristionchus entomophagus]